MKDKKKTVNVLFQVEIPVEYKKVYILGSCRGMGRWQTYGAKKMKRVGNSQVFQITLPLNLGEDIQYKYLHKRDWTGVECLKDKKEKQNRKIFISESTGDEFIKTSAGYPIQGIDKVELFRKMDGDK